MLPSAIGDTTAGQFRFSGAGCKFVFEKSPDGNPHTSYGLFELLVDHKTSGAILWTKGAHEDDLLSIQVYDRDGLLAPPGSPISTFINQGWNVLAADFVPLGLSFNYATEPPIAGLFLRFAYTTTKTTDDIKLWCNFLQHEKL